MLVTNRRLDHYGNACWENCGHLWINRHSANQFALWLATGTSLSFSLSLCPSVLDCGLIEVSERTWRDSRSPHNFSAGIDPYGKEEKKLKLRWPRLFELLRSFSWINLRNGSNFL